MYDRQSPFEFSVWLKLKREFPSSATIPDRSKLRAGHSWLSQLTFLFTRLLLDCNSQLVWNTSYERHLRWLPGTYDDDRIGMLRIPSFFERTMLGKYEDVVL